MGKRADEDTPRSLKRRPEGARQHATAGPYSPVLEVDAQRLVVISGQVAVDLHGRVIGDSIEEQTRATLGNCTACLGSAGARSAMSSRSTSILPTLAIGRASMRSTRR